MTSLQTLRKSVDALATATKAGSLTNDQASSDHYQTVIDAVKGSNEEKILACLTLPLYSQSFPSLQDAALNAFLDLIEDSEQSIRIKAITQLKVLGQNNPALVPRLADVLTQLFVSEEPAEISQILASFDALFKIDAVNCMIVLINQMYTGDEKLRKQVLDYMTGQLRKRGGAIPQAIAAASPALQAELANKLKTCFTRAEQLSINEFKQLFTFLVSLKFLHSDPNYETDLMAILHNQSINHTFDVTKDTTVDGWLGATRCIQTTKQHPVDRAPFMKYFVNQIAPVFSQLTDAQRINISRSLASVAQSNNRSVDPRTLQSFLESIWILAQPLFPATAFESFAANDASRVRFSVLEGLLVACHLTAAQSADAAKYVLGLFVPTGQPGEFAAETKKAGTSSRMTALIAGLTSWSTNIKAEITAAQATVKASTDDAAKKAASGQVGQFKADFRLYESLLAMASAFNEKLPSFLSSGAASWRRESKDSVKEKRETNRNDNKKSNDNRNDNKKSNDNTNKRPARGQQSQQSQSSQSSNQSNNQSNKNTNNKRKNDNQNDTGSKKRKGDNQQQQQAQQPQAKKQRNTQSQSNNQSNNQSFNPMSNTNMPNMNMAMNPMLMAQAQAAAAAQYMAQMQQFQQQFLQAQVPSQQQSGRGRQSNNQSNQSNPSSQRAGGQQSGRKRGRQ